MNNLIPSKVISNNLKLLFLWKSKNVLFRREDPKILIDLIGIIIN